MVGGKGRGLPPARQPVKEVVEVTVPEPETLGGFGALQPAVEELSGVDAAINFSTFVLEGTNVAQLEESLRLTLTQWDLSEVGCAPRRRLPPRPPPHTRRALPASGHLTAAADAAVASPARPWACAPAAGYLPPSPMPPACSLGLPPARLTAARPLLLLAPPRRAAQSTVKATSIIIAAGTSGSGVVATCAFPDEASAASAREDEDGIMQAASSSYAQRAVKYKLGVGNFWIP